MTKSPLAMEAAQLPKTAEARHEPLPAATVLELVSGVMQPAHFFVSPPLVLEWCAPVEKALSWEVFHGRLLAPNMTRVRRNFMAWDIYSLVEEGRSGEAILSVLFDFEQACLHVVRGLCCYAWEGYDAGGNVILSRQSQRWLRELVGTIRLAEFSDERALRDELICRLFQAVVGTSRLPLTSVEAPLPAFSFGQLLYIYRPNAGGEDRHPLTSAHELLEEALSAELADLERIKLFETWLHRISLDQLGDASRQFVHHWRRIGRTGRDLSLLLRGMFHEISLTPYTDLVAKTLSFVRELESRKSLSPDEVADILSFLLRMTARHLTAYDLVTFHHFGANYPDALLLDAVLKDAFDHARRHPKLYFAAGDSAEEERRTRLRRRGVRQGCLIRSRYEGLAVPDQPTSQGENMRVLPSSHPRVAEEQIVNPLRRAKKLYQGDALAEQLNDETAQLLRQSIEDLNHPDELRELGMALFLDRPLGIHKAPLEPDNTLLLSYQAFSRSLAERRLSDLADQLRWIDRPTYARLQETLRSLESAGVPLSDLPRSQRPAPISLDDAGKVAHDFVLLRTTRPAAERFLQQFDLEPLCRKFRMESLLISGKSLIVRDVMGLAIHDDLGRKRVQLAIEAHEGYRSRAGVEFPAAGLRALRVWTDDGGELAVDYPIRPRFLASM